MPSDVAAFPHSVASFDPTPEGVLLWTQTDTAATLDWVVARDGDLTDVVRSGTAEVTADRGCTVVVDVDGLDPATTYHYAFTTPDGERSRVGRTRTLPAPDAATDRVRVAMVSCANLARAPLTVTRALAAVDDVDLVYHAGDYIYEDDGTKGDIAVDPPRYLVSLEDYRLRYRQARRDTDLQLLHERHPMVAVWDDHDVADNTWDHGAKAHDPAEHGDFHERLAQANRARQEWVPIRYPDPSDDRRMWRSVVLGDLAELVVLDTRLGGRDEQPDDGEDLDDPSRRLLSEPQWGWVEERVTDRTRPWCLLASQVPISVMELPMPDHLDLDGPLPDGYTLRDGIALCTDQWDGYRAERDRLVTMLDRRGGGTVVLSADIHSSWVFDGPFTTDLRPVAGELTGTSISSTTMGGNLGRAGAALAERVADGMDHVRWVDLDEYGFVLVDVTPATVEGSFWAVDPSDRSATARRMSAWSITATAGARWERVDETGAGDDPPAVTGLPAEGPPAGGRLPAPGASVLGKLVRVGVVVGAGLVLRPLLRSAWRGVAAARAHRR
jgi:alkaline phosphatase D